MVCIQIIIHNTMSRNPSGMTIDRLIIFSDKQKCKEDRVFRLPYNPRAFHKGHRS